jgi:serine/threonine protein kinase
MADAREPGKPAVPKNPARQRANGGRGEKPVREPAGAAAAADSEPPEPPSVPLPVFLPGQGSALITGGGVKLSAPIERASEERALDEAPPELESAVEPSVNPTLTESVPPEPPSYFPSSPPASRPKPSPATLERPPALAMPTEAPRYPTTRETTFDSAAIQSVGSLSFSRRVGAEEIHETPSTPNDDASEGDPALDSAPPSIPSAAAVVVPREVLGGPLSQAGLQAFPGDVIADRYEVESVLGEGGMGIVYRCRDVATNEIVAVKRVIVPDSEHAPEYITWFYKEARALAALDHPSIVRARDFGQLRDGSPFLAMDLASGQSLHDLTHAGLSWPVIWHVVDQILGALAHAHSRGIVHGDLKPSNVLVQSVPGAPPLVHMLDFGLAWLKRDPHDERLDGEKAMEFKPHAGAGTPGYMAPEQIQHEQHHVCGATDIYSLGCILYKLLGRKAPFSGNSKELLKRHAFTEAPELTPAFDVPSGVPAMVSRMLAKRPWDRWEYAADARRDWAPFRPTETNSESFLLPRVRPSAAPRPMPSRTGSRGRNPALSAVAERAPGLLSIRQSPLVGREDIRQSLRDICSEVIERHGHRLVILVGPAGSGKSRIAESLCQTVHEEGTMIPLRARYRAVPGANDGMLGAVTQYYNFERADRDVIERSLLARWHIRRGDKAGRTWVAGAAEWIRPTGHVTDAPVGPSGVKFALDTLATRRAVSRHVVRRIGRQKPLLLWLDDLHNAQESTFEGFLKMHGEDADQPYVIVATVRAEDVHLGTPAAERLRHLREKMDGIAIDVTPLEPETTHELLRQSLPLEDDAVREAARRSRGNPLFALQQLHAWAVAGNMKLVDGKYHVPPEVLSVRPKTTAELWDSRVNALPEEHRLAAHAIATISADLRREVLRPLLAELGLPADEALRSLQTAEIIIPRGQGRYSWPHALLQEHLFSQLSQMPDRQRYYRAAADALRRHPLAATRRVIRQRVINLLHAGDNEVAASLLFEYLQGSWNGAREPLATLNDLDLLRGKLRGRTRAIQDRWRAEALRHIGRANEAREYAERSRRSFEELGDDENLAHCLRLLGHISSELGNTNEGRRVAEQGLDVFRRLKHVLGQAQCEAVLGEIDYLLGDFESARVMVTSGERHFASLAQPLGRGQCLLLLSWVEHSEGAVERSRRLALEARTEFDRVGYRLGTAQANASLAHVEHRMANLRSAETGALDALIAFEALRTPRGQAACRRLLAMIGVDLDDVEMASLHSDWCLRLYSDLADPWGILEGKVLVAQLALLRRELETADTLLAECAALEVEEPEPRQHQLLTQAWLACELGNADEAEELLDRAMRVFPESRRVGDHTPHILARLSRFAWPPATRAVLDTWRAELRRPARSPSPSTTNEA